jgi:hypothetical protein
MRRSRWRRTEHQRLGVPVLFVLDVATAIDAARPGCWHAGEYHETSGDVRVTVGDYYIG